MRKLLSVKLLFALFFAVALGRLQAQAPEQWSSAKILHELKRMNTLGTVLYIAAHPDDENTRLISWLVGEKGLRTGYVSLTRGDGGQNLIGKEIGPLLGLIRTQELLAARRVDGAEQFFTRAYDFGYSKTPDETLNFWNEDSILTDLVVLIRRFKPDVMICRFPTTGEGGHGHHTASAILARKAFEKAADPEFLPEMRADLWQPYRIYWNTFSFGTVNTTSPDQISLDAGTYNPLLGLSYGEIASNSRSQHKSQGFGTSAQRGEVREYFIDWTGGRPAKDDIFEGLDFSWYRIPGAAGAGTMLEKVIEEFDVLKPGAVIPSLVAIAHQLSGIPSENLNTQEHLLLNYQLNRLEEIILHCAGVWASASVTEPAVVPGDFLDLRFDFIHRYDGDVVIEQAKFEGVSFNEKGNLFENNRLFSETKKVQMPVTAPLSTPYWLANGIRDHRFSPVADPYGIAPEINQTPRLEFRVRIDGYLIQSSLPLMHRYVNPVDGELFQPLMVVPPVTIKWSDPLMVFPGDTWQELQLQVKAQGQGVKGELRLTIPQQWEIKEFSPLAKLNLSEKGDVQSFKIMVRAKAGTGTGWLNAEVRVGDKSYHQQLQVLEYGHIPRQAILSDANVMLVPLDIKFTGGHIGYISGAGDDIPQALQQLGYQVTEITESNFERLDFSGFKAIITGIRAYNNHVWLNDAYPKLMQFVQNGGNLVVQYNTNNRLGPLVAKVGPYDFEITRNRVTDEQASVKFISPHPVLQYPNLITASDFEGWVQERGIYFAGKMDPEFDAIFSMHDPGEAGQQGALIIARYGKGSFAYTGFSFFRQLPAGVTGAYKLLVNLLEMK